MAQIRLSIEDDNDNLQHSVALVLPNATVSQVLQFMEDVASQYDYENQWLDNQGNPQPDAPSRLEWAARKGAAEAWGNAVRAYRAKQAAEDARQQANSAVDSVIDGWQVKEIA